MVQVFLVYQVRLILAEEEDQDIKVEPAPGTRQEEEEEEITVVVLRLLSCYMVWMTGLTVWGCSTSSACTET